MTGVRLVYKQGDTFITPKGTFGVVMEKTAKGTFIIKWDGVKKRKELSLTELQTAVKNKWIDFVGSIPHF
jgi:hypothetical protein